jgi:hypothetical protein
MPAPESPTPDGSWRRSSRCSMNTCVEVSRIDDRVLVRDAKVPQGPVLSYSVAEWTDFVGGVKAGEFDL